VTALTHAYCGGGVVHSSGGSCGAVAGWAPPYLPPVAVHPTATLQHKRRRTRRTFGGSGIVWQDRWKQPSVAEAAAGPAPGGG
jgi:hypothetical protein